MIRPSPADFASFAPGKSLVDLALHYGVGTKMVRTWRKQCGVARLEPKEYGRALELPILPSFAAVAPTMTITALRKHYGRSAQTIRKWLDKLGIAHGNAAVIRRPHKPKKPMNNFGTAPGTFIVRDLTLAGRAADECLRRYAPTYRCDATGAALHDGFFWRHGRLILSDEELIERARRKGWAADSWRHVA